MSERGANSPERDEIVGERGAEMSGAVCCDFERWSGGSEHPRERGAGILTAQLRSHALVGNKSKFTPRTPSPRVPPISSPNTNLNLTNKKFRCFKVF